MKDAGGAQCVRAASRDGRYTLRLFDHRRDEFIHVVIDELVPVIVPARGSYYPGWEHLQAGFPVFAKPLGSLEIWPLLVEKAMAKLFGGYAGLDGGCESAAFRAFTGCTRQETWQRRGADDGWRRGILKDDELSRFVFPRAERTSPDQLWRLVEEWTSQNFLLSASIHADGDAERRRDDGLIERHAYSVLTSISIHNLKLIKLRNPWGSDAEWTGAWSDDSPLWQQHASIAEALDFRKAEDGIFWMDWRDFSDAFTDIEVSHKAMRTGPGESNREAWRSRQRAGGAAVAAGPSAHASPPPPHQLHPAPQASTQQFPLSEIGEMTEEEQMAAAIALSLSLHELGAAQPRPPPPRTLAAFVLQSPEVVHTRDVKV